MIGQMFAPDPTRGRDLHMLLPCAYYENMRSPVKLIKSKGRLWLSATELGFNGVKKPMIYLSHNDKFLSRPNVLTYDHLDLDLGLAGVRGAIACLKAPSEWARCRSARADRHRRTQTVRPQGRFADADRATKEDDGKTAELARIEPNAAAQTFESRSRWSLSPSKRNLSSSKTASSPPMLRTLIAPWVVKIEIPPGATASSKRPTHTPNVASQGPNRAL